MSRALAAGQVATAPDNLFFFNPIYLFQAILSSTIRERMHIGMAHFVDEPAELWHSTAWASSIRYSSGEFPRLPEGQVVFPSDIVLYQCNEAICRCHTDADKNHIGRILSFGRDYRSQREHRGPIGSVVVEVQKIVPFIDLMDTRRDLLLMIIKLDPLPENKELVILEDDISMVLESALTPYTFNFDIFLDYAFESSVKLRDDKSHIQGQLFIRRIFRGDNIRPLNQSRAIRGQIEIAEYGRQYLVDKFSKSSNIISIPLLAFLDGFGLFRNMYRTIMGFYLLLAPLRSSDRNKRQNVFPLTLGPHGSNFTEVTDALRGRITQLERGIDMLITGKQFTVCVSVMAYIGDMPQQQTNSGFRSVAAESTCRMCLVETAQRGLLDFDIEARGRYHYEVIRQRASIRSRPNKIQRKITADKLGMEAEDPALMKLSPALDLVLSRPPDPFHSELNGITKLTHLLWNGDLLTKKAAAEYERQTFDTDIKRCRDMFKRLCRAAALASSSRRTSVNPPASDTAPQVGGKSTASQIVVSSIETPGPMQGQTAIDGALTTKKAIQFQRDQQRPNVHIGLHFQEVLREYAIPANAGVLPGENKHKEYKNAILLTNKRNPEKDLL
ncbi:hypothetical protein P152DRAFT_388332 [Eremomyces bilateralis CBS 781.70]|uniref:Uncharacterized protein n=1 Tax=Eremomyces bilateralis CBS 781.70 TaxID=1392243 RepID=A0A6G1GDS1_9PEZI|nr:uncharacterized protein P152DRAFT_388332 [Eremomyces bilateralis CBS 781.70]KAF1816009.1 hypothetical protein P152DRAFT_388332 [Eremomyces bilateralis CBS 781.70]